MMVLSTVLVVLNYSVSLLTVYADGRYSHFLIYHVFRCLSYCSDHHPL
jgi:hypothetical protein